MTPQALARLAGAPWPTGPRDACLADIRQGHFVRSAVRQSSYPFSRAGTGVDGHVRGGWSQVV